MEEHEDHLTINNQVFTKPFVEKPVNADDHNIYIYYPQAAGGGSQRLFRKVNQFSKFLRKLKRSRADNAAKLTIFKLIHDCFR